MLDEPESAAAALRARISKKLLAILLVQVWGLRANVLSWSSFTGVASRKREITSFCLGLQGINGNARKSDWVGIEHFTTSPEYTEIKLDIS